MPNAAKAPAKTFKVLPARLNKASQGLPEVSTTSIHTATESSKQAQLITLLKARTGATISQMIKLTGWQAHTVRGTISRTLRKRLHLNVVCDPATESGVRRYRIMGTLVP